MPDKVLHRDLEEADLHEPKGASVATLGQVAIADGIGGAPYQDASIISSAIDSLAFIYKPGSGGVGPVVFGDINDCFAAMDKARADAGGEFRARLTIDDSIITPAIMPPSTAPSGKYNFDGIVPEGVFRFGGFGLTELRINEGAVFENGPFEWTRIRVDNAATATSPIEAEKFAVYYFSDSVDISNSGTVPMFTTDAFDPFEYFSITLRGGAIGGSTMNNAVFDLGSNALLLANVHNGGILNSNSVAGGPATAIYRDVRQNSLYSTNHSLLSGAQIPFGFFPPRFEVNPTIYTSATTLPDRQTIVRANASGGAFKLTLPRIQSGPYNINGYPFWIKEVSGTAGLTLGPSTGDTINGVAADIPIAGGAVQMLVPDVGGDWTTL